MRENINNDLAFVEDLIDLNFEVFKDIDMDALVNIGAIPIEKSADDTVSILTNKEFDYNDISNIRYILGSEIEIIKCKSDYFDSVKSILNSKNTKASRRSTARVNIFNSEDDKDNHKVVTILNNIVEEAILLHASDVHIESQKNFIRVRFRIDGMLKTYYKLDTSMHSIIITRIKILANLDIAERRLPQDGRFTFKYLNREIDLRISSVPTIYGEKIVIRILDSEFRFKGLESLGIDEDIEKIIIQSITGSSGMILVCGPTGSGKTSTIYSMLKLINEERVNITSIEDPVEYKLEGVNQIQVNYKTGLEFSNTLNHVLRQDPDIIFVGEMRDESTVKIALRAAITGHRVFSTVHSYNSILAINRLLDMNAENYILSSALNIVINQRLIRVLCPHCKAEYKTETEFFDGARTLYKAVGCEKCNDGYIGRRGVFELLIVDDSIKALINKSASANEIFLEAKKKGFTNLEEKIKELLLYGVTSLEEVRRNL